MTAGVIQILLYVAILVALAKPLGSFMAKVYSGERTFLTRILGYIEAGIYRAGRVDPNEQIDWRRYAAALLLINFAGFIAVYVLQRVQGELPLNPQGFSAIAADSAFNTAVSFATNTNWQGYGVLQVLAILLIPAALCYTFGRMVGDTRQACRDRFVELANGSSRVRFAPARA